MLPESERRAELEDPNLAQPPKRPVPQPPAGGLIVRGFCTYVRRPSGAEAPDRIVRSTEFYYKENPDRWAAETQSDMLWLTEPEWRSLVPREPKPGDRIEVAAAIQKRFYSTIAIDYMEGSVNSLPPHETTMTITVEQVTPNAIVMRLNGYGRMGKELNDELRKEKNSRGGEIRVLGYVNYDRRRDAIDRFDLVGVGEAWGNKMDYVHREIRVEAYPWRYGIACELVRGDLPIDRIPPYNMLHYGYGDPDRYFGRQ
jgi:hypothetical protein